MMACSGAVTYPPHLGELARSQSIYPSRGLSVKEQVLQYNTTLQEDPKRDQSNPTLQVYLLSSCYNVGSDISNGNRKGEGVVN